MLHEPKAAEANHKKMRAAAGSQRRAIGRQNLEGKLALAEAESENERQLRLPDTREQERETSERDEAPRKHSMASSTSCTTSALGGVESSPSD